MPKNAKENNQKRQQPKVGRDKKTILRVEPYMHFGKKTLQPYVNDGDTLYISRGIGSEKKFLSKEKLLQHITTDNSELCRRPCCRVSFEAASIEESKQFCADNAEDVHAALKDFFAVLAYPDFANACTFFNQKNATEREYPEAKKHATALFAGITSDDKAEKCARRVAMLSARLFLSSTSILELLALATDPKAWAKKVDPVAQQPKAI